MEHLWPSLFTPNEGRWDTSDGCVPGRVVWAYFAAIDVVRSAEALNTGHAIGLAFSGDAGAKDRRDAADSAYPNEPDASSEGALDGGR